MSLRGVILTYNRELYSNGYDSTHRYHGAKRLQNRLVRHILEYLIEVDLYSTLATYCAVGHAHRIVP